MTDKQRWRVNTLPQVPLLLVPSKENHSHSLYNVVTKRFSKSKLVVPYEGRFASFSRGWLVAVEKDLSVTLYKAYPTPTDNKDNITAPTTIRLPIIAHDHRIGCRFPYYVGKVVISADPLTNPNECIVIIIFGAGEIAFVRPNKDTHWTRVVTTSLYGFDDILYRNGQFYAVNFEGMLISFKVTDDPVNHVRDMKQVAPKPPRAFPGNVYLAESQGQLLLVQRWLKWGRNRKNKLTRRNTYEVYLYALDVEKGGWVGIKNLSDVLFLGDNSSISISCLDFPICKPNRIYFTHDFDGIDLHSTHDFGEYELEYSNMLHFEINTNTAMNIFPRIPRIPIWFVPNAQ